jgi:O-acetyl-ADP-ribose deacetylase (regulator of RNase III)
VAAGVQHAFSDALGLRGWSVSSGRPGLSYAATGVRGLGWRTLLRYSNTSLRIRLPELFGAPEVAEVLVRRLGDWARSDRVGRPLDIEIDSLTENDVAALVDAITAAVSPQAWVLDRSRVRDLGRTAHWRRWLLQYPLLTGKGPERLLDGWVGGAWLNEEACRSDLFANHCGGLPYEIARALFDAARPVPRPRLRVVRGDITRQSADAVVTAANEELRGGGGVDAAVHAAAGPALLEACRGLAPCPAGSAVVTPAFDLPTARWVVHAVGPVYAGPRDAALLASAYVESLRRADEVGARSIAFPSISTGVYGYPDDEAATVSVAAIRSAETAVDDVLLVAFGERMARSWAKALTR